MLRGGMQLQWPARRMLLLSDTMEGCKEGQCNFAIGVTVDTCGGHVLNTLKSYNSPHKKDSTAQKHYEFCSFHWRFSPTRHGRLRLLSDLFSHLKKLNRFFWPSQSVHFQGITVTRVMREKLWRTWLPWSRPFCIFNELFETQLPVIKLEDKYRETEIFTKNEASHPFLHSFLCQENRDKSDKFAETNCDSHCSIHAVIVIRLEVSAASTLSI